MSKDSGIVRRMDDLGRLVIPKSMRTILKIRPDDEVTVTLDGARIVVEKRGNSCALCGETRDLVSMGAKYVCPRCIMQMKRL